MNTHIQVYKGETLDGEKVAIKVQYIDLQERFISDIKAAMFLLKIVSVIHPKFDLHWVLDVSICLIYLLILYANIIIDIFIIIYTVIKKLFNCAGCL